MVDSRAAKDKTLYTLRIEQSVVRVHVTTCPSDLGSSVANPVGTIADVLGGSHGAGPQRTCSEAKVDLEGASFLIRDITGLVVAPTILATRKHNACTAASGESPGQQNQIHFQVFVVRRTFCAPQASQACV